MTDDEVDQLRQFYHGELDKKDTEIERLSKALSAKLRQYDADMQTMQKSLNTEIEARQAAEAKIERLHGAGKTDPRAAVADEIDPPAR